MSRKMQKYVPAIHPVAAFAIYGVSLIIYIGVMATVSATVSISIPMYMLSLVPFIVYSLGLNSSVDKYLAIRVLQSSRAKEIEPANGLSADQTLTAKWACQVWHEVTTLRKPLELSWNQLDDLANKMSRSELLRLGLKSFRANADHMVDISSPDRYPCSHKHAVELRSREASTWRIDSSKEYRAFSNEYDEGVVQAIANDSDIIGAHTWVNDFPGVLTSQELDEVRDLVADRVQMVVDEHNRTLREGAQAYRDSFFNEK